MKEANNVLFDVKGLCEKSLLHLENEGKLFYAQTSVNASSLKNFFIRNNSGLEMHYRMHLDDSID